MGECPKPFSQKYKNQFEIGKKKIIFVLIGKERWDRHG